MARERERFIKRFLSMFHDSDVRLKLSTLLEGVSSPDKISKSVFELPRKPS